MPETPEEFLTLGDLIVYLVDYLVDYPEMEFEPVRAEDDNGIIDLRVIGVDASNGPVIILEGMSWSDDDDTSDDAEDDAG